MKILAISFDYGGKGDMYEKLATVLAYSINRNCPTAEFTLMKVPPPKRQKDNHTFDSNNYKLRLWLDFLEKANDDVILMDCDMLVLHDLAVAFAEPFDVGLCKRNRENLPWNGGVVFVRNTAPAHQFMRDWLEADNFLFATERKEPSKLHQHYRNKYGGMNQSSLGYLLTEKKTAAKIKPFPCKIWNATIEFWSTIDAHTMILHVKSGLKKAVLAGQRGPWVKACETWLAYARGCGLKGYGGNVISGMSLHRYTDYGEYVKAQKKASVEKRDHVWVREWNIRHLVRVLGRRMHPEFAICHGTRNGTEQQFFKKYFPKLKVVGTEIGDYAKEIPDTIHWDFNQPKDEWVGTADFVYSNALDHAFQPEKTLRTWCMQLKKSGILVIETSRKYAKPTSATDPFSFESAQLSAVVSEWTGGKFRVSSVICPPHEGKVTRSSNDCRFILIERSQTSGEGLDAARAKAMGHSQQASPIR